MNCSCRAKTETALTCPRCATPICPKCFVVGPVGMLCKKCADLGGSPIYKISPWRFALALVAGIGAGTLVGLVLQSIGFYIIFVGTVVGGVMGEVVLRCTGRKRGKKVVFLTVVSVVGGAALSLLLTGRLFTFFLEPVSLAMFLVGVGVTLAGAIAKIQWL